MTSLHYAIVFVADMSRSVAFYRDVLGLPLRFESTHWTEFQTGDATLALHLAEPDARPGDAESPGSCRPGLCVPDLKAFHERMVEHGVPCLQPPKDLFGSLIAQYRDPDGLAISVSQARATSTPDAR